MPRTLFAALLLLPVLAPPAPLAGQDTTRVRPDSSVIRLEGIRVRTFAPLATVGGTSALELSLDSLALGPGASLEDALRAVPMLHVRRNSRGEAEVVARGSESRQVAILLDGVPLTLGWDGRTDVGVLGAAAPHSVRVLRGLSSVLHGPNAIGGVVELTVAGEHDAPPRSIRLTSGLDATGGVGASASLTLPWESGGGNWLVRSGVGWRDSPGVPLARGVVEPAGSPKGLRLNTDAHSVDGFFAARYRWAAGPWLSASASGTRASRGIAAELDEEAPRFWRYPQADRGIAALSGGTGFHDTPLGRGDLEFSMGYDAGRTEIDSYSSRSYAEKTGFEHGDDRTLTLRLLGDHTLGPRGDLRAAFTWADIRHDEHVPAGSFHYRQRLLSLGSETDWRLLEHAGPLRALRFSAGGAYDAATTPRTGDKPAVPGVRGWGARAGLSAISPAGTTALHAGVSRRGRFLALREAFSGALDRFEPNPELRPEHLTALEAGVTTRIAEGQLQVVGFHHRLSDAIVRVTLPDRRFQRVNENEVRTRGVELLATQAIGGVLLGGDLTWQSVTLISPTQRLGRTENQPELAGGAFADVPLPLAVCGFAEARHTGVQYCLAPGGEERRLAPGTQWNGSLARQVLLWPGAAGAMAGRLEGRVAVDNLTGVAIYDQCGLPQPGRRVSLQMRVF